MNVNNLSQHGVFSSYINKLKVTQSIKVCVSYILKQNYSKIKKLLVLCQSYLR